MELFTQDGGWHFIEIDETERKLFEEFFLEDSYLWDGIKVWHISKGLILVESFFNENNQYKEMKAFFKKKGQEMDVKAIFDVSKLETFENISLSYQNDWAILTIDENKIERIN